MNIESFKAFLQFGLAKPHSYNVIFQSASGRFAQEISIMAEEAEIPGKSFASNSMSLYGPAIKFPYLEVYADLRVTFMCSGDFWERIWMDDWQNRICNPKSGFFAYPDDYTRDITVQQLNPQGKVIYEGVAKKAWPITIEAQALAYRETNTYQKLSVQFAYTKFIDTFVDGTTSGDSGVAGSRVPGRGSISDLDIGVLPQPPQETQ